MALGRTTVPSPDNAYFISKFKEEKLIPLITVTRKLSSCDLHHQLKVLPHLARIFQSYEVPVPWMENIVKELCQSDVYKEIPTALYDQINSILPSDEELNLRDSVHESRLVVEEEDQSEDGQSIKKKKKLPMTLLRIPTDLQCHMFHYLLLNELANVQKVCRAMCIAARNPSAIYSMQFNPRLAKKVQFQKECFSRPKKLMIHPSEREDAQSDTPPIIGNEKWGNHVIDLDISGYDKSADMVFRKLERCKITYSPTILLNGSISSYHTLKELTLNQMMLTEDIINAIRKFQNLEKLSLIHPSPDPDGLQRSDPISLPKLKLLSYEILGDGFREFQRFLIGSKPETVIEINATEFDDDSVPQTGVQIPNMSPIHHCSVVCHNSSYLYFADSVREWLKVAPSSTFRLFDQINVSVSDEYEYFNIDPEYISSLISIFQHCHRSKLDVMCAPWTLTNCNVKSVVDAILNAPFGTFSEIIMKMQFDLLSGCHRNEDQLYMMYLRDSLDKARSVEHGRKIAHKVLMESVDDAEKWMEPWLLFNEQRMKKIGLQKLNVKFKCDLKPDYGWPAELKEMRKMSGRFINEMINRVLEERVARWDKCGRQCISVAKHGQEFEVTLSL